MKELWEVPPGRIAPGEVIYTMGWPLTTKEYGGGWIYGGKDNVVSLGFVTGLDYPDPRLDPQRVLQDFKQHPLVAQAARRRQDDSLWREIAALRRLVGNPAGRRRWLVILGDSAGFLNSQRLKGIHLAIKTGMLAAETRSKPWQRRFFRSAFE